MRSLLALYFFMLFYNVSYADHIMIGDSIFTHRNQEIKNIIESNQKIKIKNYAVQGHWFKNISSQFDNSSAKDGDIIIMDGGGNDIFGNGGNCKNRPNANCKSQVDGIAEKFRDLLNKMSTRKIDSVFFLSPYYISGLESAVDYGIDKCLPICQDSLVYCVFIDVRFAMKPKDLESDGIHPNGTGTKILANSIIEAMKNAVKSDIGPKY